MRKRTRLLFLTQKKISPTPEINFIVSILRDAWSCSFLPAQENEEMEQARLDGISFFESSDGEWLHSFEFYCLLIGVDPQYLRNAYKIYKRKRNETPEELKSLIKSFARIYNKKKTDNPGDVFDMLIQSLLQ